MLTLHRSHEFSTDCLEKWTGIFETFHPLRSLSDFYYFVFYQIENQKGIYPLQQWHPRSVFKKDSRLGDWEMTLNLSALFSAFLSQNHSTLSLLFLFWWSCSCSFLPFSSSKFFFFSIDLISRSRGRLHHLFLSLFYFIHLAGWFPFFLFCIIPNGQVKNHKCRDIMGRDGIQKAVTEYSLRII